jgi:hypothetical protein
MAGKRIGVLGVALGMSVGLLVGCANLGTETDTRLDKTVETLLEAIRATPLSCSVST